MWAEDANEMLNEDGDGGFMSREEASFYIRNIPCSDLFYLMSVYALDATKFQD